MAKAMARATTIASINGRDAYCASSSDFGSIPASIPRPMRTPGLLIMIPPTMNMMPFTIAAEVPIWLGCTTSAAVLNASMCAAFPNPNAKHNTIAAIALSSGK